MPGRFRVATWLVAERRDRVYDGDRRQANPLDERTSITVPILSVDMRLTPRWGVQISTAVPLIARTGVVQRAGGPFAFRDEVRGLGDSTAGVWYRGGSPGRWAWTLNAGVSVPTGSTRMPRFRDELQGGSLVPMSRLQRGSGTWDPVFGISAERPLRNGRWVSSLALRAPAAESREGLRVGASWEAGTGWARNIATHKVMMFGRVDWLHRQQDVFRGTPVLVGGGDWFYATPGLAVNVGKGVNVQADVRLPIYRRLANRQLDSAAIFQFGISRVF
jgi:hypothetical protein